jgi:tetratricopeptide (TPR) repeat protein
MKRESLVFLISGTFFGLLVGWILGSQQVAPPTTAGPAAPAPAAQAQSAPAPPPLDTQRAAELERTARAEPGNAAARVELANLYFNAEKFDLAIPWYDEVLKLNPKDVNASTDLGVCYYYTDQIDRALQQFDQSLAIDPRHVKTLFNQGIVRAFGKHDLQGAEASWQRVMAISPESEEGQQAKTAIEGIKAGHSRGGTPDQSKTGRTGPGD